MKLTILNEKQLFSDFSLPAHHEIHIWIFPFEKYSLLMDDLKALPSFEQQRALEFHQEKSRLNYAVSRALLRRLLGKYLNQPADSFLFEKGLHGKPFLRDTPIHFNLSHSAGYVAITFSTDTPVGIDIEKVRQNIRIDNLVTRFFHPDELGDFSSMSLEQKLDFLFRRWTIREAFLKGIGTGLSISPQSFCVISEGNDTQLYTIQPDASLQQKNQEDYSSWRIRSVPAPADYYCSIAYKLS